MSARADVRQFDLVLIFKFLMTQTLNNLSDEQTEYLINDCLPFMRFLGLGLFRSGVGYQNNLAAPKQRNTNTEEAYLREGRIPEHWQNKPTQRSHSGSSCTLPPETHGNEASGRWNHTVQRSRHPVRCIPKWKTTYAAVSDGTRLREAAG